MQKLSVFALITASLGASATAMAVLPTVALDPVDNSQSAPISAPAAGQVQTRILASVVGQDPQGQEVLSPVNAQTRLASGNVVEYRGYLTNNSPDRIHRWLTIKLYSGMYQVWVLMK